MSTLPQPDEASCAQIAMCLDHMPREHACEVLQRSATQYFDAAIDRGWPPPAAREITGQFVSAILRHWEAVVFSRMH